MRSSFRPKQQRRESKLKTRGLNRWLACAISGQTLSLRCPTSAIIANSFRELIGGIESADAMSRFWGKARENESTETAQRDVARTGRQRDGRRPRAADFAGTDARSDRCRGSQRAKIRRDRLLPVPAAYRSGRQR